MTTGPVSRSGGGRPSAPAPAILWVTDDLGATGGSVWSYALGARWRAAGCRVTVFHLTGTLESALLKPPPEIAVAGGTPGRYGLRSPGPGALLRLVRAVRRHDVVIVGTTGKAPVISFALARLTGTPIVAYSQGLIDESLVLYQRSRLMRAVLRRCLPRVDALLAVSPESVRAAIRFGVPAQRAAEMRTGLDPDEVRCRAAASAAEAAEWAAPEMEMAAAPAAAAAGPVAATATGPVAATGTLAGPVTAAGPAAPAKAPLLVAVGTLEPRKGQDRILEAVAILRRQGCEVRLMLIGPDGGTRPALESQASSLGIDDLVTFAGYLANPLPLVAAADVLVHAAHSEIVGLVLLEALAVGTPVVAHDCPAGGPRLVTGEGQLGILTDAGDPERFAADICAALSAPRSRRQRIEAAANHLREQFSPDSAAAAGLDYFDRLIAGRPLHDPPAGPA